MSNLQNNEILKIPLLKIPSIFEQIKQNIIKIKNKYKLGLSNGQTRFGFVIKYGYSIIKNLVTIYGPEAIGILAKYIENDVDIIYVANLSDGVFLRKYGIKKSIMILYYIEPSKIYYADKYNLTVVIPNIDYVNIILPKIKNNIKCHLWYDSGLGKEGQINIADLLILYNLIKKDYDISKKIQIVGIGTKYNTSDIKYKSSIKYLDKIPDDIIEQHNKFKLLIKIINNPNLDIHTACTFEVSRNFIDSFFSSVRVGTLVYRNITFTSPIIHISYRKKNDCLGYYCENTLKLNNFFNKKISKVKIGLLKNGFIPSGETKIFVQSNKGNLIELKTLFNDYDPYAIIIPDDPTINIKIGDNLIIKSNDLYMYK